MRREKGLCENVCATAIEEKKEKPYKSPASEVLRYQLMRRYLAFNIENKKKKARLIM